MFNVVAKDRYGEYVVACKSTKEEANKCVYEYMSDAMRATDGIVLVEYFVREVVE